MRWTGITVSVIGYVLIMLVIFVSAPLTVSLTTTMGDYPDGTDIWGIKWQHNYSELVVVIENTTNLNYTDLDLFIRTDLILAAGGAGLGINQCFIESSGPGWFKVLSIETYGMDEKGNPVQQLATKDQPPAQSELYRVRCARLASHSILEIRFAVVSWKSHVRTLTQQAVVTADYDAAYRHRHCLFKECFSESCSGFRSKSESICSFSW